MMQQNLFLFLMIFLSACSSTNRNNVDVGISNDLYLLVGTYATDMEDGIYIYQFNMEDGRWKLLNKIDGVNNPSYLTISSDSKHVYAVGEGSGDDALVYAFSFEKGNNQLRMLNKQLTGGDAPCYINMDKNSKFIITANYSGGNISVFPLNHDGTLSPASRLWNFEDDNRPESHIHTVVFSPDEDYLFATDLGKDRIYSFKVNSDSLGFIQKSNPFVMELEPGSGPRHLTFHPNGCYAYCINELSGKVTSFRYANGSLEAVQYIASDTTSGTVNKGSADIHVSSDGRFLYASNRLKADGIAIFKIDEIEGTLEQVGYQSTGIHPRNFIITPNGKFLLVANRDTNNVQLFEIDSQTGLLKDTGKELKINKPVCLKFLE